AAGVVGVAVHLDDVTGLEAAVLVQIVDVLGDDRRRLAGPVERGERTVPPPRLGRGKGRFHGKASPPGLVAGLLAHDELVEIDRAIFGPDAAGRAEVGDAAFRRDAGAGEGHDGGGFRDQFAEPLHAAAQILGNHWAVLKAKGRADYSTPSAVAIQSDAFRP